MMKWIIYYLPVNALWSLSLCCGNELLSSHSVDNQEHEEGDDDECKKEGENLGGDVYDEGGDGGVNDDGDGKDKEEDVNFDDADNGDEGQSDYGSDDDDCDDGDGEDDDMDINDEEL